VPERQVGRAEPAVHPRYLQRSINFRVAEVHLDGSKVRLPGVQVGLKLRILRFEYSSTASLGLDRDFTATQHGLRLIEVRFTAGKLGGNICFAGDSSLEALLGRRVALIKPFLALTFRTRANQFRLNGFLASLCGRDLCLGLINPRQRFRDARILQLALPEISLDAGAGSLNCRFG